MTSEIKKNLGLSKREISQLLEKAVLDGKVKDVELCAYEGCNILKPETVDILKSYNDKLFHVKKGEVRTSRRLLRVDLDGSTNSKE